MFHIHTQSSETTFGQKLVRKRGFPGSSTKESAYNVGGPGLILGWEVSLEKGMATRSFSCLENSMDRGAWWSIVHGVTKTWAQLSD